MYNNKMSTLPGQSCLEYNQFGKCIKFEKTFTPYNPNKKKQKTSVRGRKRPAGEVVRPIMNINRQPPPRHDRTKKY
jgi:hypothetical protein